MLAFDASDWQRIERTYTAWWAGQLDRPVVCFTNVSVDGEPLGYDWWQKQAGAVDPDGPGSLLDRFEASLARRRFPGDTFPCLQINFGAGALAGVLGARVEVRPETVWFHPPEEAELLTQTLAPDFDCPWWRMQEQTVAAAVERFGDRVQVTQTDIGGNLDILASLVGTERLLMELIDRPELVLQRCAEIRAGWRAAYDRLDAIIASRCPGRCAWAPTWSPGRTYMLQSDFAYMISPAMFERFVMPDLVELCDWLDCSFYHLDGVGQLAHLDQLLSIEALGGVQWVPGDGQQPPGDWPEVLATIRDAGKCVQAPGSVEDARKISRSIGGRGMQFWIHDLMDEQSAIALAEELYEAG